MTMFYNQGFHSYKVPFIGCCIVFHLASKPTSRLYVMDAIYSSFVYVTELTK